MPHQCTNCGRGFDDGSKEMLSGCPNCGGNKFKFKPDGADTTPESEPPERPESTSTVAKTVGKTAATVREMVGGSNDDPTVGAGGIDAGTTDTEDAAQASARGDIVSPDELPSTDDSDQQEQSADVDEDDDRPDLKELRAELNDQFESVKVLQPGQYRLNLMELYEREEYIVALQEDGRYSIQVPETIRE